MARASAGACARAGGRAAAVCAALFLGAAQAAPLQAAALPELPAALDAGKVQGAVNALGDGLASALPFSASMGLNWSDAHIGRFFPSLPPRFGAGVSGGFTTMGAGALAAIADVFAPGISGDIPTFGASGFPIPGFAIEGRIGGFFLPFDAGVKIGYLPPSSPGPFDRMDYFLFGADFRYRIFEGRLLLPTVSLGIGVNRISGGVERQRGSASEIPYDLGAGAGPQVLLLETFGFSADWATTALDFRAQASWRILMLTPYVGIGASHGWTRTRAGFTARTYSPDPPDDIFPGIEDGMGASPPVGRNEMRLFFERSARAWNARAFGGVSWSLPLRIRLDATVLWDLVNGSYGAALGARIQI